MNELSKRLVMAVGIALAFAASLQATGIMGGSPRAAGEFLLAGDPVPPPTP